jgi:hypothetical protein
VVRFHRGLGVASLVLGVLLLVVGAATADALNIVLGVVLGGLGLGYTLGRAVVLTSTELELKSPVGLTMRRFPVSGPHDLRMDGKTLVHVPLDKKILSLGLGVDQGDAERLRSWVGGASAP